MVCLSKMILAGLAVTSLAFATVNFPFPQSSNYGGNGVVLSNQAEAATQLKAAFDYYLRDKYKDSSPKESVTAC